MSDLAEIRRFWPWVRAKDQKPHGFYLRNRRGVYMGASYSEAMWLFPAGWSVWAVDGREWPAYKINPWSGSDIETEAGVRHPTIAAAMAAAGFGVMPEGKHRETNRLCKVWRGISGEYVTPALVTRQRPRKGVRLGRRKQKQVREWYTDVFGQSW